MGTTDASEEEEESREIVVVRVCFADARLSPDDHQREVRVRTSSPSLGRLDGLHLARAGEVHPRFVSLRLRRLGGAERDEDDDEEEKEGGAGATGDGDGVDLQQMRSPALFDERKEF